MRTIVPMDVLAGLDKNCFIMDSGSQGIVEKYEVLVDLLDSPSGFQGLNVAPTKIQHTRAILYVRWINYK